MYLKPLRSCWSTRVGPKQCNKAASKRVAGAPQQDALEDMILARADGRHEVVRRARGRQSDGIPPVEVGRMGDQGFVRLVNSATMRSWIRSSGSRSAVLMSR